MLTPGNPRCRVQNPSGVLLLISFWLSYIKFVIRAKVDQEIIFQQLKVNKPSSQHQNPQLSWTPPSTTHQTQKISRSTNINQNPLTSSKPRLQHNPTQAQHHWNKLALPLFSSVDHNPRLTNSLPFSPLAPPASISRPVPPYRLHRKLPSWTPLLELFCFTVKKKIKTTWVPISLTHLANVENLNLK